MSTVKYPDDDDTFAAALIGLVDAINGGATSEEALIISSSVHNHDLSQYLDKSRPTRSVPMPHYFVPMPP